MKQNRNTCSVFLVILCLLYFNNEINAQEISTIGEIYDYEIGDIFHKRDYEEIDGYEWEKLYSRTIIDKYYSQDNDTVFYTTDVVLMERESYPPGWEWSHYQHTGHITDLDSLINNGNIDSVYTDEALYNGRKINSYIVDNPPNTYNSWRYVPGCGRAYYYYHGYGFGYAKTELLYYRKGDEEWGEPILILGENEHATNTDKVKIYPNPALNKINIKQNGEQFERLKIIDVNGAEVCSQLLQSTDLSIDISELSPGSYFLKLSNQESTITKVFIKE